MILALALMLSQAPQPRLFRQPNMPRSTYAFTEFAPESGAGMTSACSPPNYVLQSETFQTTWSLNSDSAPTLGTLTANYATSPIGDLTADRLQTPSVTGPAQYSRILQSGIAVNTVGPWTCSVWVKGNASSGSIPLYVLTGFPANTATCNYTTEWGVCSLTWTPSGATETFYIGASGAAGTVAAQDISLWGAMCNRGSQRALYARTTTAAAGPNPSGAKGEPLTFARAGSSVCHKTLDGIFATSGIANEDWLLAPNDMLRQETAASGRLEILVEQGANQIAIRTAELCNAAWTDVGTPACATDQAAGPFGTTTMDSITDNDGAAFEARQQVIATTSATQFTAFCAVKWSSGAAASASITLVGTGSSTGDCTGTKSSLSTTTSDIVECTSPAAYAGTLTSVAVRIRVGTVASDQGTLLVEACDVKPANAYRTSHQPATNVAVTRVADGAPTFSGVSLTAMASSGSSAVTVTPLGTSMSGGLIIMNSSGRPMYTISTTARIFDGANEPTVAHNFTRGTPKRYWSSWTGSTLTVANSTDSLSTNGTFDGTMDTTGPFHVGASGVVGLTADWRISAACIDPNSTRCR
jgi:hypothetical protein